MKDEQMPPNGFSFRMELEDISDTQPGKAVFRLGVEFSAGCDSALMEDAARRLMAAWNALSEELDPDLLESFHRAAWERLKQGQERGEKLVRLRFPLDVGESPQ
jgi:hypothetical protein